MFVSRLVSPLAFRLDFVNGLFSYFLVKVYKQNILFPTETPFFSTLVHTHSLGQIIYLKFLFKGTLPFNVEFRYYDYKEWYPELWKDREDETTKLSGDEELPKRNVSVDDVYQNPDIVFPVHNRDVNTKWDEWWMRQEKFTRKGR
ncbi:unnamed protein product [Meloidogyne enterolobii]|uniref:Uncharacterized protein n=1 Tax=Meloidogyne enterolobii TaxID=390850 RepID=A0ACB1AHB8_MELEN